MQNSIMTIRPFRKGSVWVFTEEAMGIRDEAFVGGTSELIDAMLERAGLPANQQFTGCFSAQPFPGVNMELTWTKAEFGGNTYVCKDTGETGWLCPCLLRFFELPPAKIYVRATA